MASGHSKLVAVKGSILDAKEDFICHQCNCVSKTSAGLAFLLFQRYPEANDYLRRSKPSVPGTVALHSLGEQSIFNLFAQYNPGRSRGVLDSRELRLEWFSACLDKCLELAPAGSTYALPYGIGCGLAGGTWTFYWSILKKWSEDHRINKVVLYQLDTQ